MTVLSSTNASVDTLDADSGMSLSIADEKKRRVGGSATTIRNLLRRSSAHHHPSHENIHAQPISDEDSGAQHVDSSANQSMRSSNGSILNGGKVVSIYGDASVDSGDEIRFSVELCKFENLPGLYIVDIRRMRGNVWGYKFVYHQLLEALNLYGKGGYIPAIQQTTPEPAGPVVEPQALGCIADIQV
jgi:hypothetical protein